jgi:glycosyltransferase involved in cell wall biosynthesis
MRVAFLTWRDTTHPDGGGSEVFVEQVARELVRRGHEVTILCARHPGSVGREIVDGVEIVRTGGRLTVYPRGLFWLLRRRRRVDVVVDVINGLPFGTPLVRRHGVLALVHHLHEAQWHLIYPGMKGRIGWFTEARVVPRLYRRVPVLTVSEASRRDLIGVGFPGDAVTVVHNGVDRPALGVPRSPSPRLVVLARLVPHKRIEHAFELVERLADRHPDLHLDVVGEGWWRAELEEDLDGRGLRQRVTLHGWIDAEERDRVLGRAWVLLLPSVREGWGIAVLEAAAQGTPAVVYRGAGGVEEAVVDGETGFVASDLDALVSCTDRLLVDDDLRERLGSQAQARSREFTWPATTDAVESVLATTCRRR